MPGPTGMTPGELAARSLLLCARMCLPCIAGVLEPDQTRPDQTNSVDFTDDGGTTVPLSGGLVGFVALRCYAKERAFSLSTQALRTLSATSIRRKLFPSESLS